MKDFNLEICPRCKRAVKWRERRDGLVRSSSCSKWCRFMETNRRVRIEVQDIIDDIGGPEPWAGVWA